MLAGAYPSDEFAELKPRVVWDRVTDVVQGRRDARVVAITSGGTIPDRGLYGVFMVGEAGTPGRRVGELDEEMVYESRAGEVITLGASSWRIEDIGHDRVTVSPAPGVPGKLPFWHGDAVGRPVELGRAVGAFIREAEADLAHGARGRATATARLQETHDLDDRAAANLLAYLDDEREATGALPDGPADRRRAVPRRAGRLAAVPADAVRRPGPRAVGAGDRGPAAGAPRASRSRPSGRTTASRSGCPRATRRSTASKRCCSRTPTISRTSSSGSSSTSALFASRFRENAARALLLPRRRPGHADAAVAAAPARGGPARGREPLRQLSDPRRDVSRVPERRLRPAGPARDPGRRRPARDRHPQRRDRPVVAVREQPALRLRRRVHVRRRCAAGRTPGRRADARPRPAARAARPGRAARAPGPRGARRSRTEPPGPDRGPPGHDPRPGPRSAAPPRRPRRKGRSRRGRPATRSSRRPGSRSSPPSRRAVTVRIAGDDRWIAVEDVARYRDAIGVSVPVGIPGAFLEPDPGRARLAAGALGAHPRPVPRRPSRPGAGACRSASSRTPWSARPPPARSCAGSSGPAAPNANGAIRTSCGSSDVAPSRVSGTKWSPSIRPRSPGSCRPGTGSRPWARRRRRSAGPRPSSASPRSSISWRACRCPASVLERDILPARIPGYQPRLLDELGALGEVAWVGPRIARSRRRPDRARPARSRDRPARSARPMASTDRPTPPRGHPRAPGAARRLVLPRAVRGGRRRARPRRARRPVGPGLGRRGHQRHVRAAARAALEADRQRRQPRGRASAA